jgi:ubiquinone/menaquinone biosynthesis C-methylase UbiE
VTERPRTQRAIGAVYSWVADRFYEPAVIRGTFRLLGGDLNALVMESNRRAGRIAAGGSILDVPVGTGYFTTELAASHDALVVGADYAWGMALATRNAASRSGAANLAAVQTDIHRLPFADGSFRVVLCRNGLQVIPDVRGAIRDLVRVMAPKSTLLVSVIAAPADALVPASLRTRMPTMFRSGRAVADEMQDAGLVVTDFRRRRFAYLMEAVKL